MLLVVMSAMSWYVIVMKTWTLARLQNAARGVREAFWHARSLPEAMEGLGDPAENPFAAVAQAGLDATQHHRHHEGTLGGSIGRSEWLASGLRAAIDDAGAKLQSGLSVLASVSSTAPFIGLFGTVWGIYHALVAIGLAGQASLDKVAGPVGEALIMTALGLAVAIPAALGYNALVRGNKSLVAKLNRFGYDLHAFYLTGTRVGDGAAPAGVPANRDSRLTAVTGAKA
ncbi:MAG: MotA/TolQ/ExbB proton channel family protein [Betaproteobacteria bacterium]|nr:MotA/TolQ/ExbB proton channel family protein [Betaproteobacteria bacterium]